MSWFTAYYDAAGHPVDQRTLTLGGYLSTVPRWLIFEKKWKRQLQRENIDVFHMADFMACRGKFKNWKGRESEQTPFLLKLAEVIHKHTRHSFGQTVILDDWKRANKEYALAESHCSPYGLCGFFLMDRTFRHLSAIKRQFQAKFYFEDGDLNKGDLIGLMDQFIRIDPSLLASAKPNFEPKTVVPLQAADFAMWEKFRFAKDHLEWQKQPDWQENPARVPAVRESFQALMQKDKTWGILNYERVIDFCVDFGVPKRGQHRGVKWS
ncbi:MAG TPA: hypothetical protein VL225_04075, partial [Vicinamibacterales bacterium]|nr:hypothetical protein [Vicinamibacterales bacterium]